MISVHQHFFGVVLMLTNIFQIDAAESDRYKMPFLRIIKIHILHLQWFFSGERLG